MFLVKVLALVDSLLFCLEMENISSNDVKDKGNINFKIILFSGYKSSTYSL